MKTTVKTLWICILLVLACSISNKAFGLTLVHSETAGVGHVSSVLSRSSDSFNCFEKDNSLWADTKSAWSTDAEMLTKTGTEACSSHQQRSRRVVEDNVFLRNILLKLSNLENILMLGKTKLFYSDKDPFYALAGSDYYIYTLRRILI